MKEKRIKEWDELNKVLPASNTSTLTSELGTDHKTNDLALTLPS